LEELIFSFQQQAVMDGLPVMLMIRKMERKRVPIIGLAAGTMQEDKEKCMPTGMDDYISKPVSHTLLFQALGQWSESIMDNNEEGGDEGITTPQQDLTINTWQDKKKAKHHFRLKGDTNCCCRRLSPICHVMISHGHGIW
jgi:DNA-binding response OmpR family regulator